MSTSLQRIANALARIESALDQHVVAGNGSGELDSLRERHANLRRETETALVALDGILGALARGQG